MAFQRSVFFKFKESATEEEIQRHFDSFAGLKDTIDVIFSYSAGRAVPPPENPDLEPEYDAFHYATYATEADIAVYHRHKAHQAFVAENKDIWEKVLVLNARIE